MFLLFKNKRNSFQISVLIFITILSINVKNLINNDFVNECSDTNKNSAQIIESRGFKAEDHYIETKDGYILTVTRIINPLVKNRANLQPILLQHGFQNNANVWLINSFGKLTAEGRYVEDNNEGPVGNTLGFVLAVNGFDVWLANMRGNMYSLNHTTLTAEDPEFWRFSIDEMVDYDLPAIISYIQRRTEKKQLSYIGHSQGTYMMFGLLSTQPHYSQIIKPFIALSPVPFMGNTTSPLFTIGKYVYSWFRSSQTSFLLFGKFQKFYSQLCDSHYLLQNVCYYIMYSSVGFTKSQYNMSRSGVYTANLPSGSSSWNAAHLTQSVMENRPARYNYGNDEQNLLHYNSTEAPIYDLSAINSTNIALIYTANDWLNHLKDVSLLKQHLKVPLLDDYLVPDHTWNHMELTWAIGAGKYVNTRVLEILKKALK